MLAVVDVRVETFVIIILKKNKRKNKQIKKESNINSTYVQI